MLYREHQANKQSYSRIEEGTIEELYRIKEILRIKKNKLLINIVQPGVNSNSISPEMYYLLSCTQSFLLDTYSVDLHLICS